MRKMTKRSLAVTTAAVVAVGGGAAAWAAWTVSSSQTASVQAGSAVPVQIVNAALTGPLIPGPGTGVQFRVNNTNPFAVQVSAVTLTQFATTQSGCANSNFQVGSGAFSGPVDIAAGSGADISWANAVKLKNDPQNACQNAPVTFSVNVTAASQDI